MATYNGRDNLSLKFSNNRYNDHSFLEDRKVGDEAAIGPSQGFARDGSGNDYLYGNSGNDFLQGYGGADEIHGGADDDDIWGFTKFPYDQRAERQIDGNDVLYGEDGDDTLHGGDGYDILYGGNDNDRLYGNNGDSPFTGNDTGDKLYGGNGDDWLYGDAGDDYLDGGTGNNRIYGGPGNDTVSYEDSTGASVDLTAGTGRVNGAGIYFSDYLNGVENVIGSEFSDKVIGNDQSNNISTSSGDDTLIGAGGDDVLDGGNDTDTVVYFGDLENYSIVSLGSGRFQITDNRTAEQIQNDSDFYKKSDGTDIVRNIELFKFKDKTYNTYDFNLDDFGDDFDAPNIGKLVTNSPQIGKIEVRFDEDFFSVFLTKDVEYTFSVQAEREGQGTLPNPWLTTYGEGRWVDGIHFINGRNEPEVKTNFVPTKSGVYYLVVSGDFDETGTYIISVNEDNNTNAERLFVLGIDINSVSMSGRDNNLVTGSTGGDTIPANSAGDGNVTRGDDLVFGLAGDDRISSLYGDDFVYGGNGDDRLNGGAGADRLDGGAGVDLAEYSGATSKVRADLGNRGSNTGEAKGDSYASVENLLGSKYGDVLGGNGGANRLSGAYGNDLLVGRGGNDKLYGGNGNDRLNGGRAPTGWTAAPASTSRNTPARPRRCAPTSETAAPTPARRRATATPPSRTCSVRSTATSSAATAAPTASREPMATICWSAVAAMTSSTAATATTG